MSIRLPDPIANTTTEAYLAYKAGVLAEDDLQPKLYDPYIHLDAWLAYWTGLTKDYPVKNVGKNVFNIGKSLNEWFQTKHDGVDINSYDITRTTATISGEKLTIDSYDATGWTWISKWVRLEKNMGYVISGKNTQAIRIVGFKSKEVFAEGTLIKTKSKAPDGGTTTFNTGDYDYYAISFYPSGANDYFEDIQIEQGSTATAYEPYAGEPEMLTDEEAFIAYLSGVTDTYPQEFRDPADIRVAAYLRYLISGRWGRPEYPVNNEEFYLSLMKTKFIPSGDPSSDIKIDGTAKAPFVDVKMYGDTTQQTYSGVQVVKEQGFATPASDTDFWTVSNATQSDISSDGFSTFTFSGTGFKNFFIKRAGSDIKASTTYTIIIELDKVTNLEYLVVTQNNTGSDSFPDFTVISLPDGATASATGNATNGAIQNIPAGVGGNIVLLGTTRSELKTQTLRFYASGASSDGKKIRARVSIIEGDHSSDWQNYSGDNWQPYVGGTPSPNPDYPQAINTVTGMQTVKVTGKNLFNLNGDQQPNTRCTGIINGQSITITSTANSTGYYAIVIPNSSELLGKTATISVGDVTVSSDVETTGRILIYQSVSTQPNSVGNNIGAVDIKSKGPASATFTFPSSFQSGKNCFAVVLYVNARALSTVVGEYSTYTNIQLELGSTGTGYEPYSSNDYEINLGKNLFDKDANQYIYGYFESGTQITGAASGYRNGVVYLPCEPSTTYTIGAQSIPADIRAVATTKTTPEVGTAVSSEMGLGLNAITITTQSDARYIVIRYRANPGLTIADTLSSFMASLQVEKGPQATAYAPYFTPIELCKIGGYQDYIWKDGDEWKVHKATGVKNYTGESSENWSYFSSSGYTIWRSYDVPANMQSSAITTDSFKSNNFTYWVKDGTDVSTGVTEGHFGFNTAATNINFKYASLEPTLSNWTTWLSTHNTSVYYPLATATDTVITDQNLINQLNALKQGGAEDGTTYIKVNATDPNLPALLVVEAPKYE